MSASHHMQQQVLVIEDEKQTRDVFLDCLSLAGFEAIGASSGSLGLQLAQYHQPSLVVCDIMMPEMNGYEVLSGLRENPETAVIPVIFLTAKDSLYDVRRGMQLGVDDYITKPSTLQDFMSAVSVQIEKRSLLKKCYEAGLKSNFTQRQNPIQRDIEQQPDESKQDEFEQEAEFCTSREAALSTSIFPDISALRPVFDFIEANYRDPITLTDVARAVGYSGAYLTSQVGEQTGRTVNRWIIERRMAAARSILLNSNRTVEDIATAIGYQHACHFSRQFRKHHGQPPNAWRVAQSQITEE